MGALEMLKRMVVLTLVAASCSAPMPVTADASVQLDAGSPDAGAIDAGPADAGVRPPFDAGVCGACPAEPWCREETGCSFICQDCPCPADRECIAGRYCIRRVDACPSGPPLQSVSIEPASAWNCAGVGACRVIIRYAVANDLVEATYDSAFTTDGGFLRVRFEHPDAGLRAVWAGVEIGCLRAEQFLQESCVTDRLGFLVTAEALATNSFDFSVGGGAAPPANVERALLETYEDGARMLRDAGYRGF